MRFNEKATKRPSMQALRGPRMVAFLTRSTKKMSITYTNRKGQTYTLYQGQTKTGKPRYYFGREGQSQAELVMEIPAGFTISESVNGVVSLVKDRPSLIEPQEVAEVQEALKQHPKGSK